MSFLNKKESLTKIKSTNTYTLSDNKKFGKKHSNETHKGNSLRQKINLKRTFLSSSASLTVEAALVIPLFLFFSVAVVSFLSIISLQSDIQIQMEEAAREAGKRAYLLERKNIETTGINTFTLGASVIKGDLKKELDNSRVTGGSGGVNTLLSTYDADSGVIDIVLNYTYKIPFLPDRVSSVSLSQRSYSRAWIGRELDDPESGENDEEDVMVYITETGSVYHKSKSCSYLDLSIRGVSGAGVDLLRNKSGGKYHRCPMCAKGTQATGIVYVTDYGTDWHASLGCSGLKRTVSEVPLSSVGGMPACSKCGGR